MRTAIFKGIFLGLVATMFIGCGGSKKLADNSGQGVPITPPADGGIVDPGQGVDNTKVSWPYATTGDTVKFYPTSWEEVNQYVAIRPLNDPSNMMVNIQFSKVAGTSFYHGKVQLGYTDSSKFYYGSFTVGDGKNEKCSNCYDNGLYEAAPNFWTTINGKRTFMAYVQDLYGSLIIVMEDQADFGGDGQGSTLLKGRVYYRNFATAKYPQSSYRKCWYIYTGPYACHSANMSQKRSSTDFSDGTYRLLGTFSGVKSQVAFAN